MKYNTKAKNSSMKKGLILCLAAVMAFGMIACGGGNKKTNSTQSKVKTELNGATKKSR